MSKIKVGPNKSKIDKGVSTECKVNFALSATNPGINWQKEVQYTQYTGYTETQTFLSIVIFENEPTGPTQQHRQRARRGQERRHWTWLDRLHNRILNNSTQLNSAYINSSDIQRWLSDSLANASRAGWPLLSHDGIPPAENGVPSPLLPASQPCLNWERVCQSGWLKLPFPDNGWQPQNRLQSSTGPRGSTAA